MAIIGLITPLFYLDIIVLIAGFLGIFLAEITITAIAWAPTPDWLGTPQLSWSVLLRTLFLLSSLAIIAGYFPARKAAKMQPASALVFS